MRVRTEVVGDMGTEQRSWVIWVRSRDCRCGYGVEICGRWARCTRRNGVVGKWEGRAGGGGVPRIGLIPSGRSEVPLGLC